MSTKLNGSTTDTFHNPDRKSLEELELLVHKNGIVQPIPALSNAWTEEKTFLDYEEPIIYDISGEEILGTKDRWLEIVTHITDDLKWLLRLEFHKFWSNVLYNPTIADCLVTCLQESPTFYNLENFPNDPVMRELLEKMLRTVFVVFARLVTAKESKEQFISPEKHGSILYDNFLLTVPMMLDICQIYGRENTESVKKMLSLAIRHQPAYNEDLRRAAMFFMEDFKMIEQHFEADPINMAEEAVPLSERKSSSISTTDDLEDFIIHLLDVASSISVFLDCYSPAFDLLCDEEFVNEIVYIYGNTIPEIYKKLEPLAYEDETVAEYMELKHRLDVTRVELLKIFRTITYQHIARILEQPNPCNVPGAAEYVEQFVNFLSKAVSEKEFMLDYQVYYPIEVDLDLVTQICSDADSVKLSFIRKSVDAEFTNHVGDKNSSRNNNASSTLAIASGSQLTVAMPVLNDAKKEEITNGQTSKDPAQLASLISDVKDILCEIGEGFIEKCLKHYNYDVAAVVNAVLENSLPENLKSLDRTLPYIPPDPAEASAEVDRLLGSERLNVFDNDEFDVMTRDSIDKSRVHKGKRKDRYKTFGQLLDDKSHINAMGHIYEKYSVIQDEYEDEYDDTYDAHEAGIRGADEPLESDGRAFTTPRVLRWNDKRDDEGDEEEEDETGNDDAPSRGPNDRLNFVQDPAEMRARAEQRRLSKRGGGGGGGGGGAGGSRGPQPDVVGKPKGQGNDKSVLINRDRKNTNKASRGNHNRRSGADYKRRQGMVP